MKPPVWERLGIPKAPEWGDPFRGKTTYAARYKRPLVFQSDEAVKPWISAIPEAMHEWEESIVHFHDTHDDAIAYAHRFATDWHARKEVEPCS